MGEARRVDMDYYEPGDRYIDPSLGRLVEVVAVHSGYVCVVDLDTLDDDPVDTEDLTRTDTENIRVRSFARRFTEAPA